MNVFIIIFLMPVSSCEVVAMNCTMSGPERKEYLTNMTTAVNAISANLRTIVGVRKELLIYIRNLSLRISKQLNENSVTTNSSVTQSASTEKEGEIMSSSEISECLLTKEIIEKNSFENCVEFCGSNIKCLSCSNAMAYQTISTYKHVRESLNRTVNEAEILLKYVKDNLENSEFATVLLPTLENIVKEGKDILKEEERLKYEADIIYDGLLILKYMKKNFNTTVQNVAELVVMYINHGLHRSASEADILLKFVQKNFFKLESETALLPTLNEIVGEAQSILTSEEKLTNETAFEGELILKQMTDNLKSKGVPEIILAFITETLNKTASEAEFLLTFVKRNLENPERGSLYYLLSTSMRERLKSIVTEAEKILHKDTKFLFLSAYQAGIFLKLWKDFIGVSDSAELEEKYLPLKAFLEKSLYKKANVALVVWKYVQELLKVPDFEDEFFPTLAKIVKSTILKDVGILYTEEGSTTTDSNVDTDNQFRDLKETVEEPDQESEQLE